MGFEPTRAEHIGLAVQRLRPLGHTTIPEVKRENPQICYLRIEKSKKPMEMRGVEPRTFHMRSERSTTELHPQHAL